MQRADLRGDTADREQILVDVRFRWDVSFQFDRLEHLSVTAGPGPHPAQATDFHLLDILRHPVPLGPGALGCRAHEARPGRDGDGAPEPFAHDRRGMIEAEPDTREEMRRVADEPGVGVIVRRAGLPTSRQPESRAAGARGGAARNHVRQHARHQVGGRPADRLDAMFFTEPHRLPRVVVDPHDQTW